MSEVLESLRWHKFPIGSDGFICLVDCYGDERSLVRAARCSYGKDKRESDSELTADDKTLIRYLLRHRHSSPIEFAEVVVLCRLPIYVARQWMRHRTFVYNEYSGRYSVMIDSMDTVAPDEWRVQSDTNKQGSGDGVVQWPEDMPFDTVNWHQSAGHYLTSRQRELQEHMSHVYQERLAFGVAREQARNDLPVSNITEMYAKVDLSNLLHYLSLRADSHAQIEIRRYAETILHEIVKPLFPTVYQAFIDYRMEATTLTRLDKLVLREVNEQFRRGTKTFGVAFENAVDLLSFTELPDWDHSKRCRERDECYQKLSDLFGCNN